MNINPNIQNEVSAFIDLLSKHNNSVLKVILFGSFAKKTQHKDSDIDIAVIADRFPKNELDEMVDLRMLALKVSDRIVPIPLTSSSMQNKYHPLIGEIKKYGQVVYSRDN